MRGIFIALFICKNLLASTIFDLPDAAALKARIKETHYPNLNKQTQLFQKLGSRHISVNQAHIEVQKEVIKYLPFYYHKYSIGPAPFFKTYDRDSHTCTILLALFAHEPQARPEVLSTSSCQSVAEFSKFFKESVFYISR